MVSDCGMVEDIAWRIVVTVGIHSVFFPFFCLSVLIRLLLLLLVVTVGVFVARFFFKGIRSRSNRNQEKGMK